LVITEAKHTKNSVEFYPKEESKHGNSVAGRIG